MAKHPQALPKEVFLSHSSRNRKFARRLVKVMRAHGVPVWYSETHILGSQQWHDEIGKALKRCDWFILVLSPQAVQSIWVKRELHFALNKPRYDHRIIPIFYKDCDYESLSWTLENYQRVDFTQDFDDGCRALFRIWGIGYKKPKP
jgi:hypothetical protein